MKRKIVQIVEREEWQEKLRASVLRFGFDLHLSKAMLEFICAVADDTGWDRSLNSCLYEPDCWLSTERSLEKRGLLKRKSPEILKSDEHRNSHHGFKSNCVLTPAGEIVVKLAKMAGIFVESSAAFAKKVKGA